MRTWQMVLCMAAGALFAYAVEIAWMIDCGCIVRKSDANERRFWNEVYDRAAITPFDEMGGRGP